MLFADEAGFFSLQTLLIDLIVMYDRSSSGLRALREICTYCSIRLMQGNCCMQELTIQSSEPKSVCTPSECNGAVDYAKVLSKALATAKATGE